jgi:hypothetical protein
MQVLFDARSPGALALRDVAVQRTRFAMRRLQGLVPRARVQLDDVNGPRGGVDKRCRIELRAPAGDPVVVTSLATDWRRALDAALARATRALLRLWQRQRQRRRARPPPERLMSPR